MMGLGNLGLGLAVVVFCIAPAIVRAAVAVVDELRDLVDEVRDRFKQRARTSLDATIALLPPDLQADWAEEWLAELENAISRPVTAARLVRGLRRSASELVGDPTLVSAGIGAARPYPPLSVYVNRGRHVLSAGLVVLVVAAVGVVMSSSTSTSSVPVDDAATPFESIAPMDSSLRPDVAKEPPPVSVRRERHGWLFTFPPVGAESSLAP